MTASIAEEKAKLQEAGGCEICLLDCNHKKLKRFLVPPASQGPHLSYIIITLSLV